MNIVIIVIFGIAGAVLGYCTPYLIRIICEYKTCNKCGETAENEPRRLNWQAPLLGILSAAVWILEGDGASRWFAAVLLSVLFSLSVLIAMIDLRIRIIPNELVLTMLVLGLGYHLSDSGFSDLPEPP
jgi:hypothetical protein